LRWRRKKRKEEKKEESGGRSLRSVVCDQKRARRFRA